MNTTLDEWEILQCVVQLGGFAPAASHLNRSQSTISYAIARLQERLGIRLFELQGRKACLTEAGRAAFATLDQATNVLFAELLAPIDAGRRRELGEAMARLRAILGEPVPAAPLLLRPQRIGDIGWMVHRQGILYNQQFGWNGDFEALIAGIYSQYHAAPTTPAKDLWVAEQRGQIVGSIFVMPSEGLPGSAQLRMLYVEPAARGQGVGAALVKQAVSFAQANGYERMRLWTHTIQQSARRIYAAAGFKVVETIEEDNFGKAMTGEIWEIRF